MAVRRDNKDGIERWRWELNGNYAIDWIASPYIFPSKVGPIAQFALITIHFVSYTCSKQLRVIYIALHQWRYTNNK